MSEQNRIGPKKRLVVEKRPENGRSPFPQNLLLPQPIPRRFRHERLRRRDRIIRRTRRRRVEIFGKLGRPVGLQSDRLRRRMGSSRYVRRLGLLRVGRRFIGQRVSKFRRRFATAAFDVLVLSTSVFERTTGRRVSRLVRQSSRTSFGDHRSSGRRYGDADYFW